MIVAIFSLAIILLLAGLAGLVSAINLVPTDLGFTYFQAGATAISAGCVVLALGFAVKVLNRSLQRLAVPEIVRAVSADPVIDLPPLSAVEPEPTRVSGNLDAGIAPAISLTPAVAVAGATAIATVGVLATTSGSQVAPPEMNGFGEPHIPSGDHNATTDELERGLFAQIEAVHAEALSDQALSDQALSGEALSGEMWPDETVSVEALPAQPPASTREGSTGEVESASEGLTDFEFPLPDFALRPALEASGGDDSLSVGRDGIEPASAKSKGEEALFDRPSPTPPFFASRHNLPRGDALPIEPFIPTEPVGVKITTEVPPPAAIPAPGLIHDADFAAISDQALPSLAPLAGLDVIGAYDSGGTRFTMYSDGSVVAAGPEGERRFRSLDELRRHIDGGLT